MSSQFHTLIHTGNNSDLTFAHVNLSQLHTWHFLSVGKFFEMVNGGTALKKFFSENIIRKKVPGGTSGKEPACRCRRHKRCRFQPWVERISWRRAPQSTPAFLPGESHGQRSLVGDSPWGHKESCTPGWLSPSPGNGTLPGNLPLPWLFSSYTADRNSVIRTLKIRKGQCNIY